MRVPSLRASLPRVEARGLPPHLNRPLPHTQLNSQLDSESPSMKHGMYSAALLLLATLIASGGVAFARPQSEIDLGDGAPWRGGVGDSVRVSYQGDGERVTVEGRVIEWSEDRVVIESDRGARTLLMRIDLPGEGGTVKRWVASYDLEGLANDSVRKRTLYFLTWRGMVGTGARHEQIDEVGKLADKAGPGQVIVLHIDSPGGLVTEGDQIHASLVELKKRHRVVAWIKKAISAGAYTSLHCDEIYFEKVGNLGAITMFSGTTAISGDQLDAWLDQVGDVCELGGRSPWIGRAMVSNAPLLSYDRDADGNVTWYDTLEGEFDLSDEVQNLSLTAETAVHCKFAGGIADTRRELVELLGYKWNEVRISPESDAIAQGWEESLQRNGARLRRALRNYRNPGRIEDAENLGIARRSIEEVIKVLRECQPAALEMLVEGHPLWPGNMPPEVEAWEDLLERVRKALAEQQAD